MIKQIKFGSPEYETCKRLRNKVLRKPLGLELSTHDVKDEEKQIHIAAFDENNKVQATVTLKPLSEGKMKLRQMAVIETAQGKGLGAKLVQFAENAAKDKGFFTIEAHARSEAKGFYEKLGFKVQGDEFSEMGLPHFKVEKIL